MNKLKLLSVIFILLFGFLVTSVKAEDGTPAGARGQGKFSLLGGRLKSCQAREESITTRLGSLTKLVVMMEGKFDAIAKRVEEYYTSKVVPSGKTLPNYQALVDDIAAKKALVDAALAKATADSTNFSCTGGDPKGLLKQYRLDMQTTKKALEAYRKSIKNLIVAVRTLVGGTESPEPSEKPKATATPVVTPIPTATPI